MNFLEVVNLSLAERLRKYDAFYSDNIHVKCLKISQKVFGIFIVSLVLICVTIPYLCPYFYFFVFICVNN